MSKTSPSFYTLAVADVLTHVQSVKTGLSSQERIQRQKEFGKNILPSPATTPLLVIFFHQFTSPFILLLLLASSLLVFLSGPSDAIVVSIILVINAVIGTFQEGKAQASLQALSKLTVSETTILQDSQEKQIDAVDVVVGDIIMLREGDQIPADGRIIRTSRLTTNEAILTGESFPLLKQTDALSDLNLPLGDQTNMVWKGTTVTSGNGMFVVTRIGTDTQVGAISTHLKGIDTEVPLTHQIEKLSHTVVVVVALIGLVFFAVGTARGVALPELLSMIISLCVSVIPEGLPVIVTVVLAMGVSRMSKRNAVVKRLKAVEALGHAQVIAVDKTGTITTNELRVSSLFISGDTYTFSGNGFNPEGSVFVSDTLIEKLTPSTLKLLAHVLPVITTAHAYFDEQEKTWNAIGDPTEVAIQLAGLKLQKLSTDTTHGTVIATEPFDYAQKYSKHLIKIQKDTFLCFLGAPEEIGTLFSTKKNETDERIAEYSKQGLRVIALALFPTSQTTLDTKTVPATDGNLCLFAIEDTIQSGVAQAVKSAHQAGLHVVMITGDHKETALHIARTVGIYKDGDVILTGPEIETSNEMELIQKLPSVSVFARVSPEQKLSIIRLYHKLGKTIAMTGDGVNDATSLVAADLGIAMGRKGTDVAKEAADIVLLDNNFASITAAIEEGRNIYATLKRVIAYLFSTSAGEVGTIAGALILGLPLPLLPTQLIWLNFITDGFLDIALSLEPTKKSLMHRSWTMKENSLFTKNTTIRMIVVGLTMAVGSLFLFALFVEANHAKALTMSLTTLAAFQWFNAWNCRSENKSLATMNPFSNIPLIIATIIVVSLQLLAIYTPFLQKILHTTALSFSEFFVCIGVASSIIAVDEARKYVTERKKV